MFITGGWLGCCLFFVISGYCLCIKYNPNIKYFDFIKERLIKILPAYYIAIVIWYFLIKMGIAPKSIGLIDVLSHIFLVHNLSNETFYSISGVFWFLGVLFNFYLIFPFLYKIQEKTKVGLEVLTLIIFSLSIFLSYYFSFEGSAFNKSILINLPCFVFGMVLFKRQFIHIFKNKIFKIFLLLITLILLFFVKSNGFLSTPINLFAITESLLISLVCFIYRNELIKSPNLIKSWISDIALASYSIYLYNYIFYATNPQYRNSIIAFIYIFLVFGFGLCMYKVIECPINKLINNVIKHFQLSKHERD